MSPLAKVWTSIGQTFAPLATGWAVYVRGGLSSDHLEEGVLISRGYWGLLVSLVAGTALLVVAALYVREAKRRRKKSWIPTNTTFDEKDQYLLISRVTSVAFALSVCAALFIFGSRYADSRIYAWDGTSPLAAGFLTSREFAHTAGCPREPCFAVAQRISPGHSITGVNEYVLYWTDGSLAVMAVALLCSLFFLIVCCLREDAPPAKRR